MALKIALLKNKAPSLDVNIERDAMRRLLQVHDAKIVVRFGYDRNSNTRYTKAHAQGQNQTVNDAVRESWRKRTVGGRVTLCDGVLQGSKIKIAPGQGMVLNGRTNAELSRYLWVEKIIMTKNGVRSLMRG